jgi:hypothetical protein
MIKAQEVFKEDENWNKTSYVLLELFVFPTTVPFFQKIKTYNTGLFLIDIKPDKIGEEIKFTQNIYVLGQCAR